MALFDWLRRIFPPPSSIPYEEKPPTPPYMVDDLPPNLEAVDPGVRIHRAAHDPDFPAKRDQAYQTLRGAISTVAEAQGFTAKAQSWMKQGPLGVATLHIQRSRYGFECYINLGFQPNEDAPHGIWENEDHIPLGRFYPPEADATVEPGTLIYLDIFENPAALDKPMEILSTKALPWLQEYLTNQDPPPLP